MPNGRHTIAVDGDRQPGRSGRDREPVLHGLEWRPGRSRPREQQPSQTAERRTAVSRQTLHSRVDLDRAPLLGRRGWDLARAAPCVRAGRVGPRGRPQRGSESRRVAARAGRHEGYLRDARRTCALPIGSQLDASTGVFTWAPGVGFVGAYDFVFVRSHGSETASRRDVRIILAPKGSGLVGPQVVIDDAAIAAGRGAAVRAGGVGGGSRCARRGRASRPCTRGRTR